jgi:hypothetical protein
VLVSVYIVMRDVKLEMRIVCVSFLLQCMSPIIISVVVSWSHLLLVGMVVVGVSSVLSGSLL